jgi:TetR/AcrR family transcriptional regulator, cholesterol catabolism regulator
MELKARIVEQTSKLINRYGLRAVTMDEVAAAVGASKKTIYQYYTDKETLLMEVLQNDLKCFEIQFEKDKEKANAIEEALSACAFIDQEFRDFNPLSLLEMQKYFPKMQEVFLEFKEKKLYKAIYENLERGIAEGIYRNDIDVPLLTRFRIEAILMAFISGAFDFKQFHPEHVSHQLFIHFIRGLVNQKGLKILEDYLEKTKAHL